MYCLTFGLLLTIFAAAVTCQSCESARRALSSNQDCLDAFSVVTGALRANRTINLLELNSYCQPSCRNLVNAVLACENDPDGEENVNLIRFNRFLCNTDYNGTSCYDFVASGCFNQLLAAAEASGACEEVIPNGQVCSSACRTAFQNLVIDGGCCVVEVIEFRREFRAQLSDSSLSMELLKQCPIDLSRGGTCVEICGALGGALGGAHRLEAFVSVLLIAVALALVSF